MSESSTKPYLIRAIYEWCADNGYTPFLAVSVDRNTIVPRQFVKNGEIVLNVSPLATNAMQLGNDLIEFQARFGGKPMDLSVPVDNVTAIYAKETGHGMAFDVPKPLALTDEQMGVESENANKSDLLPDEGAKTPTQGLKSIKTLDDNTSPDDSPVPPKPPARPSGKPRLTRVK